ncbi:MAG: hypothetical protein ACI9XO_002028 [Paraglaciecola sp.]|jgi:hypothetical protein
MKKALQTVSIAVLCFLFSLNLTAQNDTLLYEGFQGDLPEFSTFPDEDNPQVWTNWDEDQIAAAAAFPSDWFQDLEFAAPDSIAVLDSNFVMASRSWLEGYDPTSSNWLILPEMEILDDQATFHWKSSPFQGPRYMDGYAVKVLVGNVFFGAADQVDEVFRAAEMTDWIGDNQSLDPDSFLFDMGYIHANAYTDSIYFEAPTVDTAGILSASTNGGILEPHSVSLADYVGQSIFIAIHHDSSDDNLIEIDDLLLMGNANPNSTNDDLVSQFRYVTYPNPVDNYLNVLFRLQEKATVKLELYSIDGKLMKAIPQMENQVGEVQQQFNLTNLPSGNYSIVLDVDGQRVTRQVTKR